MKTKLIKIFTIIFSFGLIVLPFFVFAQINNPLGEGTTIQGFITKILGYVVKIGGVIAVFMIIYSGFLYATAQGSSTKLEVAHEAFRAACIGTAILLGAQLIATIIVGTINSLK